MAIGDITFRRTGGTVGCATLRQWHTYSGLIEGSPCRYHNEAKIARLNKEHRRPVEYAGESGEPYLVPPMIRPIHYPDYPFGIPEALPAITCVALYAGHRAELTIIWFQDELAFPIAPHILEHLEGIDFPALAMTVEED